MPRLVLGNQPFDDDDVAPRAVEPGVLLVDADLAKADACEQRAAGRVLDEHARHQLPEARRRARPSMSAFMRDAAGALPAGRARDVDRKFRDAGVALARAIR